MNKINTPLSLNFWAKHLGLPELASEQLIKRVQIDSRQIQPGDLFVAIPGKRVDGHDYIAMAKEKGAAALLVNRPVAADIPVLQVADTVRALGRVASVYWQSLQPTTVAITGSCGKTTVKEMTASILCQTAKVLVAPGNYNTDISVPLVILALKPEHPYLVLEMGACRQGDLAYLTDLFSPDVSLVNNVGPAHLETFGNESAIAQAKAEIYVGLKQEGIGIVNLDQSYAQMWLAHSLKGKKVITYGIEQVGDVIASEVWPTSRGNYRFTLATPLGSLPVQLAVPGKHNVYNALAAASIAYALAIPLAEIKRGLEQFVNMKGRLNILPGVANSLIIDDTYNANPASTQAALQVLSQYSGEKILVLGDMAELGEECIHFHAHIGKQAKLLGINRLLGYGELSHYAVTAFGKGGQHFLAKDQVIETLQASLSDTSIVLVKGSRCMRMEEIVNRLVPPKTRDE